MQNQVFIYNVIIWIDDPVKYKLTTENAGVKIMYLHTEAHKSHWIFQHLLDAGKHFMPHNKFFQQIFNPHTCPRVI